MLDSIVPEKQLLITKAAVEIGLGEIKIVKMLSAAEGGKYLIQDASGKFVMVFTGRDPKRVAIQQQLIDMLNHAGVNAARIVFLPIDVEDPANRAYISEWLEGTHPEYSRDLVRTLSSHAGRLAAVAYAEYPDTGTRHDPRPILNQITHSHVANFLTEAELDDLQRDLDTVIGIRFKVDSKIRTSYIHADIKAQNALESSGKLQLFDFDNIRKDVQFLDLAYLLEDYFISIGTIDLLVMSECVDIFVAEAGMEIPDARWFKVYMMFAILDKLIFSLSQAMAGKLDDDAENMLKARVRLWKDAQQKLVIEG